MNNASQIDGSLWHSFLAFLDQLNDTLWSYLLIPLLALCALYFTVRLRGVQFTKIAEMFRLLLNSGEKKKTNKADSISSFQAFAVSLSSRVGTGNLAGVASAIAIGGPGAVFWMWVMAFLGAATAFFEATLAQLFKRRGEDSFYGGPAYYMQHGLHQKWMGILFAVFIIYTFGMANQVAQSNTLCDALSTAYCQAAGDANALPPISVAVGLTLLTFGIIFGGIQRISKFAAMVVPFMAVGYLLLAIYILVANIGQVPHVMRIIFDSAFGVNQAVGGMVGAAINQGVRRGLFSNEAGEGSAPNAAATADISHPVKQGLLQSLGVFTDTIVICSCTAIVILLSGLYDGKADGIVLTGLAMEHHLGCFGRWFLTAAIFLFAYSTIIANYFYGETNIRFITRKEWAVQVFRVVTGFTVLAGGFLSLQQIWAFVDLGMLLMTLLNLTALVLLSRWVVRLYKDYFRQKRDGRNPEFHRSMLPEIENDIECWE